MSKARGMKKNNFTAVEYLSSWLFRVKLNWTKPVDKMTQENKTTEHEAYEPW